MNAKSDKRGLTEPKRDGIERLLATSVSEGILQAFHLEVVSLSANAVDRRGLTVFYTVASEDLGAVLAAAERLRVTIQRRVATVPYWMTVLPGDAPAWSPERDRPSPSANSPEEASDAV